jgi:hypothetical protein
MPVWVQEAIACVSMLMFLASVTLLAASDQMQAPAQVAGDMHIADTSSR